jgi:Glycosyl hydrolase family 63 C-terminal domain
LLDKVPGFKARLEWYLDYKPELAELVSRFQEPGHGDRRLLSLLRRHRLKRVLQRVLDENEFFSPFGVRALSQSHRQQPYELQVGDQTFRVSYQPGESDSGLFGGNSNWRGPIWFPVNYLIVESLRRFHSYYGSAFEIECPTGSGRLVDLGGAADELARRLGAIFLPGSNDQRPLYGQHALFQNDPQFRDHLLFFEYFHGDTGRGVGASHQTGWTALIADLLRPQR